MKNPWVNLKLPRKYSTKGNYILPTDRPHIEFYNKANRGKKTEIITNLMPVPFQGKLNAPILILLLNPGYAGKKDVDFCKDLHAYKCAKEKLLINNNTYFFHLDEYFIKKSGGNSWWLKVFKSLIKNNNVKIETLKSKIWCIEYFPYHSKSYKLFPFTLEAQQYNFYLLKEFIKKNRKDRIVLIARGANNWRIAVPELNEFSNCYESNNPRISSISPKMYGEEAYKKILTLLNTNKAQ